MPSFLRRSSVKALLRGTNDILAFDTDFAARAGQKL